MDLNSTVASGIPTYQNSVFIEGLEPGRDLITTAYLAWKLENGYTDGSSDTLDEDHDGLGLLMEFAFSLDPLNYDDFCVLEPISSDPTTFRVPLVRDEVSLSAERSENLLDWSEDSLIITDMTSESGDYHLVSPSESYKKFFLRIKVESNE